MTVSVVGVSNNYPSGTTAASYAPPTANPGDLLLAGVDYDVAFSTSNPSWTFINGTATANAVWLTKTAPSDAITGVGGRPSAAFALRGGVLGPHGSEASAGASITVPGFSYIGDTAYHVIALYSQYHQPPTALQVASSGYALLSYSSLATGTQIGFALYGKQVITNPVPSVNLSVPDDLGGANRPLLYAWGMVFDPTRAGRSGLGMLV